MGLLISAAILVLLWGTIRSVGRRLMDGIDPDLLEAAEHALAHTPGVQTVESVQLRWVGHRLQGQATVVVPDMPLTQAQALAAEAERRVRHELPKLEALRVHAHPPHEQP